MNEIKTHSVGKFKYLVFDDLHNPKINLASIENL